GTGHRHARDRAGHPRRRGRRGERLDRRLPVLAVGPDLRGHQRDPAQHHRRAAARSTEREQPMRFALSPEQLDFAGSVRKLLDSGRAASAVRAWSAGDRAPGRALIGQLAEQGVLGLAIGERYDGAEAEPVDLVVAFVELGRAAAAGPLTESAAAVPALLQSLSDTDPAQRWLPGIAAGETLATVAFAEPGGRAVAVDADAAEVVLLVSGDTLSLGTPGAAVRSIDPARGLFAVEAGEVVAQGEQVRAAGARAFDAGVLASAAQQLGAGRALLHAA